MHGSVSAETLNALLLLDSCSVANAIEELDVRLRNEGLSGPSLRCRFPKNGLVRIPMEIAKDLSGNRNSPARTGKTNHRILPVGRIFRLRVAHLDR
jgi:hypothetical protein